MAVRIKNSRVPHWDQRTPPTTSQSTTECAIQYFRCEQDAGRAAQDTVRTLIAESCHAGSSTIVTPAAARVTAECRRRRPVGWSTGRSPSGHCQRLGDHPRHSFALAHYLIQHVPVSFLDELEQTAALELLRIGRRADRENRPADVKRHETVIQRNRRRERRASPVEDAITGPG